MSTERSIVSACKRCDYGQRESLGLQDTDERKRQLKWSISGESRRRIENMLTIAKTLKPITDSGDRWDMEGAGDSLTHSDPFLPFSHEVTKLKERREKGSARVERVSREIFTGPQKQLVRETAPVPIPTIQVLASAGRGGV